MMRSQNPEPLVRVLLRSGRTTGTTYPATGFSRKFAIHSTGLALTRTGKEHPVRFPKSKKNGMEEIEAERGKRNSLARSVQASFGRLPACDLALPTEVTRHADSFTPFLGLLRLFVA